MVGLVKRGNRALFRHSPFPFSSFLSVLSKLHHKQAADILLFQDISADISDYAHQRIRVAPRRPSGPHIDDHAEGKRNWGASKNFDSTIHWKQSIMKTLVVNGHKMQLQIGDGYLLNLGRYGRGSFGVFPSVGRAACDSSQTRVYWPEMSLGQAGGKGNGEEK